MSSSSEGAFSISERDESGAEGEGEMPINSDLDDETRREYENYNQTIKQKVIRPRKQRAADRRVEQHDSDSDSDNAQSNGRRDPWWGTRDSSSESEKESEQPVRSKRASTVAVQKPVRKGSRRVIPRYGVTYIESYI